MIFSNGDAQVGLMIINWGRRDILLRGLHSGDEISADEVINEMLSELPDQEIRATVWWEDEKQFCLYDLEQLFDAVGVEDDDGYRLALNENPRDPADVIVRTTRAHSPTKDPWA